MLYPVLASIIVWSAILFALRACLTRWNPPAWAHRTINATGATIAVVSVLGVVFYTGLRHQLAETSILWAFS